MDFFDGLAASNPVQLNFLKIGDCCGGFECKIERVTKLTFVDDFKEWSFGQFGGLLEFQRFQSRPIAHIYERMSIMDVFDVKWKGIAEFLQKCPEPKIFLE